MKNSTKYDIYCDFDVKKHKETYIDYLEVIIEENGHISYAIPSHQEKLISLCMEKNNWTREQMWEAVPTEMYFDVLEWLCDKTKAVSVWNKGFTGKPNHKQTNALKTLKLYGVYKGNIS